MDGWVGEKVSKQVGGLGRGWVVRWVGERVSG